MSEFDAFRPAWWLPGPHLQTVWGSLARSFRGKAFSREVLPTPDHDELLLDHLEGPAGSPRVVLLHGLEGSSYSVYVQGLLAGIARRGWRATALNFRSCARDPQKPSRMIPNLRPRLYHSGETEDLNLVLRTLAAREPEAPLTAVGVSLGGNVLLKWLGEHPDQSFLSAAVALSVPFDLSAGARLFDRGMGRLYGEVFLRTLRKKAIETARRFPEAAARIDVEASRRARTLREFDEAANAPLHGFRDAEDYYAKASSIGYLALVRTPALCLSAEDDPFLPAEVLPRAKAAASPSLELVTTRFGGHIGFVGGSLPGKARFFAEEIAVDWLEKKLQNSTGRAPV